MNEEPQRRPSRGMPLRTDRILRYVVAFCAACHREHPDRPLGLVPRLSGYLAEQDGKVWLVRGCPRHGKVVTLYDRSEEHTSELQSRLHLVCRLLLEKKKKTQTQPCD